MDAIDLSIKYPSDMTDGLAAPPIPRNLMRRGAKLVISAVRQGVRAAMSRVFNLAALLDALRRHVKAPGIGFNR